MSLRVERSNLILEFIKKNQIASAKSALQRLFLFFLDNLNNFAFYPNTFITFINSHKQLTLPARRRSESIGGPVRRRLQNPAPPIPLRVNKTEWKAD
jgi:hypothetical protein